MGYITEYWYKRLKIEDSTRDEIADEYARLIPFDLDFCPINSAILRKYKLSGLIYIKEKAWKIIESK